MAMVSESLPFLGWRLYLSDGKVVDSRFSTWEQAPAEGIALLIVFYAATYPIHRDGAWHTENYVSLLHGEDYYWRDGDSFIGGNATECAAAAPIHTKRGTWLPETEWRVLYNQAYADTVF